MVNKQNISRRQFVSTAVSAATLAALPTRRVLAEVFDQERAPVTVG
jgi:hypothetical protein